MSIQPNPGGQAYEVINSGNFEDLDGGQQSARTLADARKALTSIRPKTDETDRPLTAEPVHDILAFILSKIGDISSLTDSLHSRRGALQLPGLFPFAANLLGRASANDPINHVHWVYSGGNWRPTYGATKSSQAQAYSEAGTRQWLANQDGSQISEQLSEQLVHEHTIDFGQCPSYLPLFFHAFDPPLPHDAYVQTGNLHQNLSVRWHINQQPLHGAGGILSGVDLTDTNAIVSAMTNALQSSGHQVWTGDWSSVTPNRRPTKLPSDSGLPWQYGAGLAWTSYGNSALVADRFKLGTRYYWGPTYEMHLTYWLYKAYWSALIDLSPDATTSRAIGYSINPYGINYWPGGMDGFPVDLNPDNPDVWRGDYDLTDVVARWMGRDPEFNFDEFVKDQIWGSDGSPYTSEQKETFYQEYILSMDQFADSGAPGDPNYGADLLPPNVKYFKRFTADGRCHPNSCRVPLHIGYTIQYVG